MTVPSLDITAQDVLVDIWRNPDTPPTVVPTWSVDNTRGELDALRIGRAVVILHGGEFEGGPTYWMTLQGSLGPVLDTLCPHGPPTYHDTTEQARAALNQWVAEHTTATERVKP